jgi:hypothetical protein
MCYEISVAARESEAAAHVQCALMRDRERRSQIEGNQSRIAVK